MRKDFYIFRHGQTNYNLEKRWQGSGIDTELNSEGISQARGLIDKLADSGIEIIYSSALKRAMKTAEIVAEAMGLKVKIIENLREGSFGEAEGMTKSDVAVKYPEIYNAWYDDYCDHWDIAFPGGETKKEMQTRMLSVLEELLSGKENIIGIASHGSSIRYLLLGFGLRVGKMENTALYHIVYEDGAWSVEG